MHNNKFIYSIHRVFIFTYMKQNASFRDGQFDMIKVYVYTLNFGIENCK